MAGRGPNPKPAHLRQRTNKVAGSATLPSAASAKRNKVRPLPNRVGGWHPMVTEWWRSVWRSPMASEYLEADVQGGLYLLAELYQKRWTTENEAVLVKLAAEIRQQEIRFGLTPMDRSRLRWEVEKGEEAAARTKARRAPRKQPKLVKDPRASMKLVS